MNKTFICLAAVAALLSVSCKKETAQPEIREESIIHIDIDDAGLGTRAGTPDVSSLGYETHIRKVEILVFNEKGQLNLYHDAGTELTGIQLSVNTGKKDIWVIVNGPEEVCSVIRAADLKAIRTLLEDNVTSGDGMGFIMAGNSECTVMPSENNTCTVTVHRFATRVALTRLSVKLPPGYPQLKVRNVMLTDVVANQNLGGTAEPLMWYNPKGLAASGLPIDGSSGREAECPDLTFRDSGTAVSNGSDLPLAAPWYFYGYPNPTVEDMTEADGSFKAERTRLVVTAEIEDEIFYYTVPLPSFKRNTAYEVELTIEGLGTGSPDILPQRGVVDASVSIQPWGPGAVIIENI